MGTRKSISARLLALGCVAAFCLGGTYTWTDGGGDADWDTAANWSCSGACGSYPDTSTDDASVSGYDVDLVDECIEDFTVSGTVTFGDADATDPVLYVENLTINGPATTSIQAGAEIRTRTTCP